MKKANLGLSKDTSVLFATFSLWANGKRMPTNGSVEPLRDFLVPLVGKMILIDQLVPGEPDISYKIEEYSNGKTAFVAHKMGWWFVLLKPFLQLTNSNSTQVPFKIRDFLSVLDWAVRDHTIFDYFIGLESINALAGIILRKLGRVKKVIYYVSDYSPNRYKASWFNSVYLWLDRLAATNSDFIWDVSKAMHPARIKAGLDGRSSAPVIHVPNGLLRAQIKALPYNQVKKYSFVYMGTLGFENGPDLFIQVMQRIVKRFPTVTLHVVGGGERLDFLKTLALKLKLGDNVIFYGYVPDGAKMSGILQKCAIGVAPYRAIEGSVRYYADAGKIRAYCAAGLPVISSDVPPLGKEVANYGGAVIVNDTIDGFAEAAVRMISDHTSYLRMRQKAFSYAKNCSWENTFTKTFLEMRNYVS